MKVGLLKRVSIFKDSSPRDLRHAHQNHPNPMAIRKDIRALEFHNSIRRILYHEWDPIGIAGAAPEDEYDAYIAPVHGILAGSRSEQELVEFLFRTARDTIGVACDSPEQMRPVARRLLDLDVRH